MEKLHHHRFFLPLLLLCRIFFSASMLNAQTSNNEAIVQKMQQDFTLAAGGAVDVTVSPVTGLATFVAPSGGRAIPLPTSASASPEEKAKTFFSMYGKAFGINDNGEILLQRVHSVDEVGMEHIRFQQVYKGVPVAGGEVTVHLRDASVVAVNAKTLPHAASVDTTPKIDAEAALIIATQMLSKHLGVNNAELSTPRLEIFNRGLLEGRTEPTHLAWFIEAKKIDLREYIWVDAHTEGILLHFSQLPHALNRKIYTAGSGSTLPGALIRSEGDPATGDADADLAYKYAGDTYNYYFSQHGRDSFDGAGSLITSTVHYCPTPAFCPFANAFWNGTQMVYGDGFSAADDVDAHELTHAVTEYSANLFYYMQSGALNESFSDIFGETVDLTNGVGTDTSLVRWQLGEDVPGSGAIRNMMNPTLFGDPGKVSDSQFFCPASDDPNVGGPSDRGGVHSNSGVPNHAYALMVDGGSYNGFNIFGIGLTKAGKIQYRVLTQYLLSASDFLDNYNAIKQSCADLIGTAGITAADCTQVGKALDAVQMANPVCGQPATPALCPVGQGPTNLFFDNLESGGGNWLTNTAVGPNLWFLGNFFATSGSSHLYGVDNNTTGDSRVLMATNIAIPAGGARMQFNHSYGFENDLSANYDGGVIEYSTNGGTTWNDVGALISAGAAYNGTISAAFGNPLGGRSAFVRESFGYTASQLNLTALAGQNVRFRFRIGTDSNFGDEGWLIDDVRIYTCAALPPPPPPTITNISNPIFLGENFVITGSGFSPGSCANFFVSTATGPMHVGCLTPSIQSATQLTIFAPASIPLGQGVAYVEVVNTDQGYPRSNGVLALLLGSAGSSALPSITGINGVGLSPTSDDPGYAPNVETVVGIGSTVTLNGTNFDTAHGVAIDVFCACPGGKLGPFFLAPGNSGLTGTAITFVLPGTAPTGPGSFLVSNKGVNGNYSLKSNAVSVPIGATPTITSIIQTGTVVTVNGAGFSTLSVINLFNLQGNTAINLGGLNPDGSKKIPLTVLSSTQFQFIVPAGAVTGPAYVMVLNPPFIPFSSSGLDPDGAFTITAPPV